MLYNVVLFVIHGKVIHICIYITFQILFHYWLFQDTGYSSLCYTIGPCHLSLLYIVEWKRKWQPTPVFLPGESHGEKSLEGYSPWGCKESDTTERLTHTHTHTE